MLILSRYRNAWGINHEYFDKVDSLKFWYDKKLQVLPENGGRLWENIYFEKQSAGRCFIFHSWIRKAVRFYRIHGDARGKWYCQSHRFAAPWGEKENLFNRSFKSRYQLNRFCIVDFVTAPVWLTGAVFSCFGNRSIRHGRNQQIESVWQNHTNNTNIYINNKYNILLTYNNNQGIIQL